MLVPIDDTNGDPVALSSMRFETRPSSNTTGWLEGHVCAQTVDCRALAALEPDRTYMCTWHDSTANAKVITSVSVDFVGSAVFVKAILAGPNPPEFMGGLDPEYYISINGTPTGSFQQSAPPLDRSGPQFLYNVTIYEGTNLPFGRHSLTVEAGRLGGPEVLFLLDAILYDDAPSDSFRRISLDISSSSGAPFAPSSIPTSVLPTTPALSEGTLIGLILGPFLGLALGVAGTILIMRYRRHHLGSSWLNRSAAGRYEVVREPPEIVLRRRRSIADGLVQDQDPAHEPPASISLGEYQDHTSEGSYSREGRPSSWASFSGAGLAESTTAVDTVANRSRRKSDWSSLMSPGTILPDYASSGAGPPEYS